MTIMFDYHGKARVVWVEKETDKYVQGMNLHANAKTQFATYFKSKIMDRQEMPQLRNQAYAI